jgi:peptide-methionine (S)-S-oxide reductase
MNPGARPGGWGFNLALREPDLNQPRPRKLSFAPSHFRTFPETNPAPYDLTISTEAFMFARIALALFAVGLVAFLFTRSTKASSGGPIPAATTDDSLATSPGKAKAVFAGGCFWGTQGVFERVKGVVDTAAGYSGGSASTATYDQVTTETTGHAESVEVVYDPSRITYGTLLRIFFSVAHDPTQLNRQGPDVGTSYRSAIFYENDDQKRIAQAYIAQLDSARIFPKPIVTEVSPLKGFYRAEDYHQDYALHNPGNPYILICDRPKIEALRKEFPDLFVDYKGKH